MFRIINLKKIIEIFFVIYILFLIYILFFKPEYRLSFGFEFLSDEHISYCLNLKPLSTIQRYFRAYFNNNIELIVLLENILGNFVLFMPLSFFINYRFPKINILQFSIFLICITILIEFLQFILMLGIADIDDIILNFIGALSMFIFIKLYKLT